MCHVDTRTHTVLLLCLFLLLLLLPLLGREQTKTQESDIDVPGLQEPSASVEVLAAGWLGKGGETREGARERGWIGVGGWIGGVGG